MAAVNNNPQAQQPKPVPQKPLKQQLKQPVQTPSPQQPQQKGQVIETVAKTPGRKRWKKWLIVGIILFVVIIITLAVLWILAKSGIARVPLMSARVYDPPAPHHKVIPKGDLHVTVTDQLTTIVYARLRAAEGDFIDRTLVLEIPEATLAKSVQDVIEISEFDLLDKDKAQAAVNDDGLIEVYVPLKDNKQNSAIVILIDVVADYGLLAVEVVDVYIGQLKIPDMLARRYIEPVFNDTFEAFNEELGKVARIDLITTKENALILDGEITVKVIEL